MGYESSADDAKAALEEAIASALQAGGDMLLEESNDLAPEDDGDLKASGSVSVDGTEAEVSYDADHAIRQHERTDFKHDDGQAKFLETALYGKSEDILQEMVDVFNEAIGE